MILQNCHSRTSWVKHNVRSQHITILHSDNQHSYLWMEFEASTPVMDGDPSRWLLVAVLVSKLRNLTFDVISHIMLDKHVCGVKNVHDELLRCGHWRIHINNELSHRYVTGEKVKDKPVDQLKPQSDDQMNKTVHPVGIYELTRRWTAPWLH